MSCKWLCWSIAGICWAMGFGAVQAAGLTLHVSTSGRDTWSGALSSPNAARTDGPLATLTGARDAVRRLRVSGQIPAGGVTVEFQRGRYEQTATCAFAAEDSGTTDAPVVYRAASGAEVRVSGGVRLWQMKPLTDTNVLERLPEAARGQVRVVDLVNQGLFDYGVEPTGSKAQPASGTQLTYNDALMTLARWPNEGFVNVATLPQGPKGPTFTYAEERISRWAGESDPRGMGYWAHDWAACAIAFDKLDPATRTLTQRLPGSNYGFRKGGRWYGYNLLCELDAPGEYYVDRLRGRLYFWPPDASAKGVGEVSVCVDLLRLSNVSNVTLRGLVLENGRGCAVRIDGGEGVAVVGCTIRNMGGSAVEIRNGERHRIAGCELAHLGNGGVAVWAGDPAKLVPSGHVIDNNHITDFARFCLTYGAAVQIGGCGNRVSHNLIHDGPHVAVLFGGRENVMEYNEIHSICLTSGEMGAFYTGRDWTLVGNVINGNYVHDIYNPCSQRNRAIMLDDGAAGIRMTSNLIVRVAEGISLSAVDNVIDNNVFVECHPAISGWQTWTTPESFIPPRGVHAQMPEMLAAVPVDASPWKERYPQLAMLRDAIRDKTLRAPATRTRVERNVIWGGPQEWMVHYKSYPRTADAWLVGDNNLAGVDPLFVNSAKDDYRMKPDSPAFKKGFKPMPIDKMGLYASAERAVWPVKHAVRIVCPDLSAKP